MYHSEHQARIYASQRSTTIKTTLIHYHNTANTTPHQGSSPHKKMLVKHFYVCVRDWRLLADLRERRKISTTLRERRRA
jgi:hypothetical protein